MARTSKKRTSKTKKRKKRVLVPVSMRGFNPPFYERPRKRVSRNPQEKLEHEESRYKTRAEAEKQAKMLRTSYRSAFKARVQPMPSRSRPGETSYAVIISPTKSYEPVWRDLKGLPKKNPRRRVLRNPPPQLFRAIGVDSSGHRRPIGSGPVSAMRETAMARWLGDPSMRSAYVVDRLGHSHLTLEPRDRSRLQGNGRVSREMEQKWDRVNYAVRLAEKSGDYRAAEAAKAEVNRVYREMQNVRLGISSNPHDDEPEDLRHHHHTKGDGSWWENDARGIPLTRVCDKCREAKLSRYRPEILTGYDQSDVDEPIEPEDW